MNSSVIRREYTYGSPSKVTEETRYVESSRRVGSRSPIRTTKVVETDLNGSNKKTTTITFDGPVYTSKTVIENEPEYVPQGSSYRKKTTYVNEDEQPVKTYSYTKRDVDGTKTVSEYEYVSPSRSHATKVVYDNDPMLSSSAKKRVTTRVEKSPLRNTVTTTVEKDSSPYRSTVTTTQINRDEPQKVVTRTVRENGDEYTTITRYVEPEPIEEIVEKVYESPNRTYKRTIRDNGFEKTVTTDYIRNDPIPVEKVRQEYTTTSRVYSNDGTTRIDEYTKKTLKSPPKEDFVPTRRLEEADDTDVVVLKYTSPYRSYTRTVQDKTSASKAEKFEEERLTSPGRRTVIQRTYYD